jgi:hypothetical protein
MLTLLKLEEIGLFLLSVFLFSRLEYSWWLFPALFLAPDLSVLGYIFGPRVGALSYNAAHHKGIAAALFVLGGLVGHSLWSLAGVILLGHSSLDRALGYGLKYPDSFHHTHLGRNR